jgi:hypothetical protein
MIVSTKVINLSDIIKKSEEGKTAKAYIKELGHELYEKDHDVHSSNYFKIPNTWFVKKVYFAGGGMGERPDNFEGAIELAACNKFTHFSMLNV